jgi:NitT/TauT family transport system substrate-binding protein
VASGPFKLSVNSWVGWGPLFIAKERNFFDGLDVDIRFVEDAGARRTAMLAGQVDGYGSSVDNLAIDATFGVTGKTVLCFDESAGADGIVAKSEVSWEKLKGRKVAVQKGLPGHFLLLSVLSKHGLKSSDVQIMDLDADKAGSAFVAGNVDVAVTWEPWISKAAGLSGGKVLITTKEMPGLIVDTLVVRDPVLQSRPADVRRIIQGWFKAIDWYKKNPEEGNKIIAAAYTLKPDEVKDMVGGIKFYDQQRNRDFMGTMAKPGPIYKLFGDASALWKDAGVVQSTVQPATYIDPSHVD